MHRVIVPASDARDPERDRIRAVEGHPSRPPIDPAILTITRTPVNEGSPMIDDADTPGYPREPDSRLVHGL